MADSVLIVVHGMGNHTEASVMTEVTSSIDSALSLYPDSGSNHSATSSIDIVPVAYNDIFDDYRQKVASEAGDLASRLEKIGGSATPLAGTTNSLNRINMQVGDDDVFLTHWLDVILYRYTLLSKPIQLRVAQVVADQVSARGSSNVHIMGHSLGTAVVHDSLSRLYSLPITTSDGDSVPPLKIQQHKLGGVHMVANVSRLLQHRFKVGVSTSLVKPGEAGCTSAYYEYRHKLDPFTKFRPFDPTDNEVWINHDAYEDVYRLIHDGLTAVTEANVHALGHYIRNPAVHLPLLKALFGFRVRTKAERDNGRKVYLADTVSGKAEALQETIGKINPADEDSIKALLEAGQSFKDMVRSFGEIF